MSPKMLQDETDVAPGRREGSCWDTGRPTWGGGWGLGARGSWAEVKEQNPEGRGSRSGDMAAVRHSTDGWELPAS